MAQRTLERPVSRMALQMPADLLLAAEPTVAIAIAVVPEALVPRLASADMHRGEMRGEFFRGGKGHGARAPFALVHCGRGVGR